MWRIIITIMLGFLLTTAYASNDFALKSKAFANNGRIPDVYTCNGKNTSPELSFENIPDKTQSLVLILFSPDWPDQNVHLWILYNIPPTIKEFPVGINRNLPEGILVGNNYYNETNYRGPCPPDDLNHHYVFVLYALDTTLDLPDGADFDEVVDKMRGHILKKARLVGIFSH